MLTGEQPGLQVLAESAYESGETRAAMRSAGHREAIKPIPLRAAVPGGFTRDNFVIDHTARTATTPGGHTVAITAKGIATFGPAAETAPSRAAARPGPTGKTLKIRRCGT